MRAATIIVAAALAGGCGSEAMPERGEPVASDQPRLAVGVLFPLTVRGSGFGARERVTLTLSGTRTARASVTASRAGTFTVRLRVRLPRCGSALVRAVGSQGSRASREVPRPDCREP